MTNREKMIYGICVGVLMIVAIYLIVFGVKIDKDIVSIFGMILGFPIGIGIRTIINWDTKQ